MQIVEVREGYIKFESVDTLPVSSFVEAVDNGKRYVAQVLQCKNAGSVSICYAKIQFLYQDELISYDKTLPAKNAELRIFPYEIVARNFDNVNPIIVGNFSNNQLIVTDKGIFDKNIIVSIDNPSNNKVFVSNTLKQFDNGLVIDMLGVYNAEEKFVAGVDFKLPLNTSSLEFMYQDCLDDATAESKNLIKEIFQDLSKYSETVKFVPFSVLKSIVDDMVNKEHIFKLLVLKNKLAKFEKLGYFASTLDEVSRLEKILSNKNSVIDLSKLDAVFQNRYLTTILDLVKVQEKSIQIVLEASNAINKQNLKRVFTDDDLSVTFVTHSRFKYINELKTIVENFLVEPNSVNKEIFKSCKPLLDALSASQFLVLGKAFCGLALASTFEELNLPEKTNFETVDKSEDEAIIIEEEHNQPLTDEDIESLENSLNQDSSSEDDVVEDNEISAINRKSEELIEKVAEEMILEESTQNIFAEEDDVLDIEVEEGPSENIVEEPVVEIEQEEDINVEVSELELAQDMISEVITENIEKVEKDLVEEENFEIQEEVDEVLVEENNSAIEVDEESLDVVEEPLTEENIAGEASAVVIEDENEFKTEIDEIHTIEIPKDISDLAGDDFELVEVEESLVLQQEEPEMLVEESNAHTDDIGFKDFTDESETIAPTPITAQSSVIEEEFDEIMELDVSEISDEDILIDISDEVEILDEDSLDKQIVEDVDKVFTTMKEDSISDSDLDFIDELNSSVEEELVMGEGLEELSDFTGFEEVEDDGFIEPLEEVSDLNVEEEEKEILETKQGSTPIVPVYGADIPPEDFVMSDPIEQGDTVTHAKYGIGVVEKMIKYGTKTLYSINFDNVGRRLLDPTLTEIKKS